MNTASPSLIQTFDELFAPKDQGDPDTLSDRLGTLATECINDRNDLRGLIASLYDRLDSADLSTLSRIADRQNTRARQLLDLITD